MNPFAWIRRKAAEAFALGVSDGLRAITPEGEDPPADIAGLRALVATAAEPRALTAGSATVEPEAELAGTSKRKAK